MRNGILFAKLAVLLMVTIVGCGRGDRPAPAGIGGAADEAGSGTDQVESSEPTPGASEAAIDDAAGEAVDCSLETNAAHPDCQAPEEAVAEEPEPEPSPEPTNPFYPRDVVGKVAYASQCPAFGTFSNPVPVPMWLWDCPVSAETLEVTQPPKAMTLMVDCKEMVITVRTGDRVENSGWLVMPNGQFYFSIDGGTVGFKDDGMGTGACTAKMPKTEFYGKINCSNPDKPIIDLITDWNLENDTCKFPAPVDNKKCHLYSYTQIKQCE